jgi:uracil-DNA glycosylase family 4
VTTSEWEKHQRRITRCKRCPRLIEHCQNIATVKRAAYRDFKYWGKPVPDFGSAPAELLIVGLAPGAHGANRTGRMFTGDRSGDWLFKAMHKAGFANQPNSSDREDGLELINAVITAVCNCAPPDNKPTREEVESCEPHLDKTIALCRPKIFLALGKLGWDATIRYAIKNDWLESHRSKENETKKRRPAKPKFSHGAEVQFVNETWLIGSYHPSQQNTFTGRLTEKMFNGVFRQVKSKLK